VDKNKYSKASLFSNFLFFSSLFKNSGKEEYKSLDDAQSLAVNLKILKIRMIIGY
jgi:hypothetical protein